jgi:predicted nicotinamide N-methyase
VTVWDGSLLLAFILCHRPALVRGKRVLELGAGTGLLGIVCARLGAVSPLSISPSLSPSLSLPPSLSFSSLLYSAD